MLSSWLRLPTDVFKSGRSVLLFFLGGKVELLWFGGTVRREEMAKAHLNNADDRLFDNAFRHFGLPFDAVGEGDGNFADAEAERPGREFHFDLKGITDESNTVEVNRFKHFSVITNKSGGRVFNGHPGDQANVDGSAKRKEFAVPGPVGQLAAADITRADHQISLLCRFAHAGQILWIVAEITIHFYEIGIAVLKPPAKSGNIGGTQPHFTGAFEHKKPVWVLGLQCFDEIGGAVRGIVVYNKYMEGSGQLKDSVDHTSDIFPFIISGNNNQAIRRFFCHCCQIKSLRGLL